MRRIIVIGAGPGAEEFLTLEAVNALNNADVVVAAARHVNLAEKFKKSSANIIELKNFKDAFNEIKNLEENKLVIILVSGDTGIYSLLPLIKKNFADYNISVIPGISSLQSLCAAAGEMWHDAVILSGHGRPLSPQKFLNTVERNKSVLLFCGEDHSPNWAVDLIKNSVGDLASRTEIIIGERLSYQDECVTRINPDIYNEDKIFDILSLVLIKNDSPWEAPAGRLKDIDFERGDKVPMTREEVRTIILDKLNLNNNAVFIDIGAGTGSISCAAALEFPECEVHAIEFDESALQVINKNLIKFRAHNIKVHAGKALSVLNKILPGLNNKLNIFIGGSGGELGEIIKLLESLEQPVRLVISSVTLDTLSEAVNILLNNNNKWKNFEAVQAAISSTRPLGKSLLMSARNPVFILSVDRV